MTQEEQDRLARATVRRSAGLASRFGIIVGSSFYLGMVPALAATYFEQTLVILRVAAIYGRDPAQAARAAEILFLQGRYPTIDRAEEALEAATAVSSKREQPDRRSALRETVRQLPSMIGLQLRQWVTTVELILNVLKIVAMVIPLVSIPLWVYVNRRTTRRFGRAASAYYRSEQPARATRDVTLPEPPTYRRTVTAIVGTTVVLSALTAVIPLGWYSRLLPVGGVVLAEVGLVLAMLRLLLITRPTGVRTG